MIPFLDLHEQYQSIKSEIDGAIRGVLDSACFVLGPEVDAFEKEFAEYCSVAHAIAVNSGTSALHLAFLSVGIGPGDEVITTPMTFVATTAAILYAGATPVFVDIDPRTRNIDVDLIEAAITSRTRAIVPVHLHGLMADMGRLMKVAEDHELIVIEDAAQAHGAEYRGRRSGSIGQLGCFSFYPGKNLGAYGEGGAVITNDGELATKMRILRDWGQSSKHNHVLKGYNYRMDAIQAAVLRVKLRYAQAWTEGRRNLAARYDSLLSGSDLITPARDATYRHVYHVYAIQHSARDIMKRRLEAAGIGCGIHYPVPVHLQPAYRDLGYGIGAFPVAERFAAETLSLPIYPELDIDHIEQIAGLLHAIPSEAAA
ncbi:MAG TPA: DegT/DnrJ/EryC1/StrS family aminotransferase [Pseudolabrys sp.]|nr:DegT/DnrJ/EryC1/StrS family aminotransferase [Pseudolabrys sp.]